MNRQSGKTEIAKQYSDGEYLQKNKNWHEEDSAWKSRQILRILKDNGLQPGLIAEVGCGAGQILIELSKHYPSSRFFGYELSEDAYQICKSKSQENVEFHLANILILEKRFDVLLCIDVFEHIENYIEFLREVSVKAEYCIFHIPLEISINSVLRKTLVESRELVGHLHYFTFETAVAALEDAGYEILSTIFTAPFASEGIPPRTLLTRMIRHPRRLLYRISPNLLSRTLGGCSLLVLAKNDRYWRAEES